VTLPEAGVDLLTGQRVGRELALEALEVRIVEAAKAAIVKRDPCGGRTW
jgi:hypothetical protein